MQVYPAASLVYYTKPSIPIYFINPKDSYQKTENLNIIEITKKATLGVPKVVTQLIG